MEHEPAEPGAGAPAPAVDVAGRGVVVTGAGAGIGRALARRFASEGARVVVNDLDADAAAAVAAETGGLAAPGDAATPDGVADLLDRAREHLGAVEVYCANAGTEGGAGLEASEADWARALEVNVLAHVRAARLLVPEWVAAGHGRLVVTASAAGLLTMLGSAPYAVTKHAAVAFAEWVSVTYGDRGVTTHAICPQGVRTRMLEEAGAVRDLLSRDRVIEPDEVADALWAAMATGRFLVLPHPEVAGYHAHRAAHPEVWLAQMRRLQRHLDEATQAGGPA